MDTTGTFSTKLFKFFILKNDAKLKRKYFGKKLTLLISPNCLFSSYETNS